MAHNLFKVALNNTKRNAIRDAQRNICFTYNDLLYHSNNISQQMNEYNYQQLNINPSYPPRVTLLMHGSFEYIAATYAIWSNSSVTVPLCIDHPINEMNYYVNDCQSSLIIAHKNYQHAAHELSKLNNNIPYLIIDDLIPNSDNEIKNTQNNIENYAEQTIHKLNKQDPAVFIYTSGTTSLPKGVVHTNISLYNNAIKLSKAWHWHENDSTLSVLPMHHAHGLIINAFNALANAASITFQNPKFNPLTTFESLLNYNDITIMMAVPTIYSKLIHAFHDEKICDINMRNKLRNVFENNIRLMVSGSASLSQTVMKQWHEISGHWLLERWGTTEMLICTTNPYYGIRKPGSVGLKMDDVEIKIIKDDDNELLIKNNTMFKEYYNRPDKTKEQYTNDGWYKTGDCGVIDEDGYYKIEGRKYIDIIKYGGYKISSLDIETVYLTHPNVKEIVVVGIEDEEYGQIIGAIVKLKDNVNEIMDLKELRKWGENKLAKYKLPGRLLVVDEIPTNAVGKYQKTELVKMFEKRLQN
eukprot:531124_1